jgi:hypothetical protein
VSEVGLPKATHPEDAYRKAIRCRIATDIAGAGGDPATIFEILSPHRSNERRSTFPF